MKTLLRELSAEEVTWAFTRAREARRAMTWRQFRRHANYATSILGVEPQNSPFDISRFVPPNFSYEARQGDKAFGESVLHEVAHAVALGLTLPWGGMRIAAALGLGPLTSSQTDLHEILAVAAVVAFAREHGLRLSSRRLTHFASKESMPHINPARVHKLATWLSRRSRARATAQAMATMLGLEVSPKNNYLTPCSLV